MSHVRAPARTPVSTYRLQLGADLTLASAASLAPYLARLGVTECYCSPVLAAAPGSAHGYDICDHARIDAGLGGEEGWTAFTGAIRAHGLGLLLDFVPNHMSIHAEANAWWRSVLENGPSSPFAHFFDIDWEPVKPELRGKVLLPILGEQYGVALHAGHLHIEYEAGKFRLRYFGASLPLNPRQMRLLLRHDAGALETALGVADPCFQEFQSILFQLDHLPARTDTDPDKVAARMREKDIAAQRLERLVDACDPVRQHVERNVRHFNGVPGDRPSFDLLHELLEAQAYRLSYWRTATHEINYRRFFDVNALAGIRMEAPDVFSAAHARLADMAGRGEITGVRLDHIDGLFDPAAYLRELAGLVGPDRPLYTVVEKILSGDEPLRPGWQVHGTTGYDFLNDVNGLFVDAGRAHAVRRVYARFTGRAGTFDDVAYEAKKLIILTTMASELNVLAHDLNRTSEREREYRDFTLDSLQDALREIVACFPVYRTYFVPGGPTPSDDRAVSAAVSAALRRNAAMEPSIFHFIRQMLVPVPAPELSAAEFDRRARFAMKFQQYTGPVQAKGVEDTAFYRYAPLASLNEVGGRPDRFGRAPSEFHFANARRLEEWPLAMIATATHDTKRGEDARARLSVLSEIPEEWRTIVSRWSRANASARVEVNGEPAPDRHDEMLFYQALLGAWPAGLAGPPGTGLVDRMRGYLLKAVKEEKIHTSWVNPSEAYDAAVTRFVDRALTGSNSRSFLAFFLPFQQRVARLGAVNSLSQLTLKLASPGVPDFYQGTELWDLSLVDPDSRRVVDFELRAQWLDGLEPVLASEGPAERRIADLSDLLATWESGRIKLYYTAAGLRLRRRQAGLFLQGSYEPLEPAGERADHLVAFCRALGDRRVVVLAPRLVAGLCGSNGSFPVGPAAWGDTTVPLPPDFAGVGWRNAFTGERLGPAGGPAPVLRAADALATLPATILVADLEEDQAR